MSQFRPTVEVLDARTLPSAAIAGSDDLPSGPAAEAVLVAPSCDPATTGEAGASVEVTSQGVHFAHTGKVTSNDIHFTQTVNKASPKLF